MVNFIKAWSLNARLFCQKIGSKHQQLLFHTAGVLVLQKLFFFFLPLPLPSKVKTFIFDAKSDLAHYLNDIWLAQLSYFADIFNRLNLLNTLMQGEMPTSCLSDKVSAFMGISVINKNVDISQLSLLQA